MIEQKVGTQLLAERLTIGALSGKTGCSIPTIRYYEKIGLLPLSARATNGHRYYREADLTRLNFIKRCRDFGFPIEQVRAMAGLSEEAARPCADVRAVAQAQLDLVRDKLRELRELEVSLAAMVRRCGASCADGTVSDCTILEDMAATQLVATELRRP